MSSVARRCVHRIGAEAAGAVVGQKASVGGVAGVAADDSSLAVFACRIAAAWTSRSDSRSPRVQDENGAVSGDTASTSSSRAQKEIAARRRVRVKAGIVAEMGKNGAPGRCARPDGPAMPAQTTPSATMARATLMKPAILAPFT